MAVSAAALFLMAELFDHWSVHTGSALHLDGGVGDMKPLRQEMFDGMEDCPPPLFAAAVNIDMH